MTTVSFRVGPILTAGRAGKLQFGRLGTSRLVAHLAQITTTGRNSQPTSGGNTGTTGRSNDRKHSNAITTPARRRIVSGRKEAHREEFTRGLHVHHIRPLSAFGDVENEVNFERANRLDNLITVCVEHHHLWERASPLRLDTR